MVVTQRNGMGAILFLALSFWAVGSASAGISVSASVSRTRITTADRIQLSVEIRGAQDVPEPQLPASLTQAFEVTPIGTSQNIQIVNNQMSVVLVYNYILLPRREGVLQIEPITVTYRGKRYRTEPIVVEVSGQARAPNREGGEEGGDLYLVAEVSNARPYPGEQVLLSISVVSAYPVLDLGWAGGPPQFDGFLVEEMGDKVRQSERLIHGRRFNVLTVHKALFPVKTGKITIPEIRMDVRVRPPRRRRANPFFDDPFDDFFDNPFGGMGVQKRLVSEPVTIEVQPLPPGKPSDFSGLVGKVRFQAEPSATEVTVGESLTLTMTVEGDAYLRSAGAPPLPPDITGNFKIYDDQPTFTAEIKGERVVGRRIFKKALAPKAAGEYAIGPLALTFFDPEKGRYETVRSVPFTIRVKPAPEKEVLHLVTGAGATGGKERVRLLTKDILEIHTSLDLLRNERITFWRGSGYLLALLLPVALYGVAVRLLDERRRLLADPAYARKIEARARALASLDALAAATDRVEIAKGVSLTLRNYIGDHFGLTGSALTAAEVDEKLATIEGTAPYREELRTLLETCEAIEYGGGEGANDAALVAKARTLIEALEGILGGGEER